MAGPDSATQELGNRKPAAESADLANAGDALPTNQLTEQPAGTLKNTLGSVAPGESGGKKDDDKSSLRIRIELDLEVEVHLTARVKGDITIGLL